MPESHDKHEREREHERERDADKPSKADSAVLRAAAGRTGEAPEQPIYPGKPVSITAPNGAKCTCSPEHADALKAAGYS
jgi:hypothetical protein